MRLVTLPGVFRPTSDCWLLADVMRSTDMAQGARVLDVFTGSGALAIAASQAGARAVTAIDISRRAVLTARINARLNRARVRVLRGDLLTPVAGERFDLIVANPPYVPGDADGPDRGGRSRAWEGGTDGRALLDHLCAAAPGHLEAGGALLVVQSSLTGEHATLERLTAAGFAPAVLVRRRGPLGPIIRARAGKLEQRGLLRPGEREEDLIVLRASFG